MVTELRMARALRDAAAYRIAEVVALGEKPLPAEVEDFKRLRDNYRRMIEGERE